MSTNFYATKIPNEQEISEMQNLLMRRQINTLRNTLNRCITYHIGKRSSGWQFLFCPHVKMRVGFWDSGHIVSPWNDTLESIKEYLSREDVVIEDEYGTRYSPEQFWKEIDPCLYNDPENHINGKQYYERNNTLAELSELINDNSDFEYTTDEGLRFSTTDDFL